MTGTLADPPVAPRVPVPDVLLDVDDLVVQFRTHDGTIHAVNGISFQLARGERLGLVGESGVARASPTWRSSGCCPSPPAGSSAARSCSTAWTS